MGGRAPWVSWVAGERQVSSSIFNGLLVIRFLHRLSLSGLHDRNTSGPGFAEIASMCGPPDKRRLPQELADIIIDHLHMDRETLKHCSLVCKDWLPSSSLHLLRCVAWPRGPHRHQTCDHQEILDAGGQQCMCHDPTQTSFRACTTILQSSSRLQLCVREIRLTSQRPKCLMRVAGRAKWEKLEVSVITSILDILPNLECLHLERCALKSSGRAHNIDSALVQQGPRHSLRELSVRELVRGSTVEPLNDLLGFFQHLGKLTVEQILHWERSGPTFVRPLPALSVEHLVLHVSAGVAVKALCHELRAHTHLAAMRTLTSDWLDSPLIDFVCAARNLESLVLIATRNQPPIDPTPRYTSLRRLTVVTSLGFDAARMGFYSSTFRTVAGHMQTLSMFHNVAEITLEFRVHIDETLKEDPNFDLHAILEPALSPFGEWQAIGEALNAYGSLRAVVLKVRNVEEVGQACKSILRTAATRHLSKKYVNLLRIANEI